jgi:hypothetical protein
VRSHRCCGINSILPRKVAPHVRLWTSEKEHITDIVYFSFFYIVYHVLILEVINRTLVAAWEFTNQPCQP